MRKPTALNLPVQQAGKEGSAENAPPAPGTTTSLLSFADLYIAGLFSPRSVLADQGISPDHTPLENAIALFNKKWKLCLQYIVAERSAPLLLSIFFSLSCQS